MYFALITSSQNNLHLNRAYFFELTVGHRQLAQINMRKQFPFYKNETTKHKTSQTSVPEYNTNYRIAILGQLPVMHY